jgi:hypothetical protein
MLQSLTWLWSTLTTWQQIPISGRMPEQEEMVGIEERIQTLLE